MCYRVNSDNSGRATGVSYYGPDGSDNTIEAEIVIAGTLHLRQHAPAAALEDREIPERACQFERAGGQAHHGAYRRQGLRRVRRPLRQQLHGPERAEARARRLQRRQFRSQDRGLHPRLAGRGRDRRARRRPARRCLGMRAAARHAELGRRPIAISSPSTTRATPSSCRRPRNCLTPTRPSISIPTCATPGACRLRA